MSFALHMTVQDIFKFGCGWEFYKHVKFLWDSTDQTVIDIGSLMIQLLRWLCLAESDTVTVWRPSVCPYENRSKGSSDNVHGR